MKAKIASGQGLSSSQIAALIAAGVGTLTGYALDADLKKLMPLYLGEGVVDDSIVTPTFTVIPATGIVLPTDLNASAGCLLVFTTGNNKGLSRCVEGIDRLLGPTVFLLDSNGSLPPFNINALPSLPLAGDRFYVFASPNDMVPLHAIYVAIADVALPMLNALQSCLPLPLSSGSVTSDIAPTINGFSCDLAETHTGFYDNAILVWNTGANKGSPAVVSFYTGKGVNDAVIIVSVPGMTAFPMTQAPTSGDTFTLYAGGNSKALTVIIQSIESIGTTLSVSLGHIICWPLWGYPAITNSGNVVTTPPLNVTAHAKPVAAQMSCWVHAEQFVDWAHIVQDVMGAVMDWTIAALNNGASRANIYVSVDDATGLDGNYCLFADNRGTAAAFSEGQNTSLTNLPDIFALLTDGAWHTLYIFLWCDAGDFDLSYFRYRIGCCAVGSVPTQSFHIDHLGMIDIMCVLTADTPAGSGLDVYDLNGLNPVAVGPAPRVLHNPRFVTHGGGALDFVWLTEFTVNLLGA